MKKQARMIVFGVVLFALAAGIFFFAARNRFPWPLRESNIEIYDGDKRTVEIKEGTLTPTGATVILKNNEKYALSYGFCVGGIAGSVQVQRIDGQWFWIDAGPEVCAGLGATLHSEKEIQEDWSYVYGKLLPGKYRYVIGVSFVNTTYLACEFTITIWDSLIGLLGLERFFLLNDQQNSPNRDIPQNCM